MIKLTNIYSDGSPKVFTSPKQDDTYLYITGAADDIINQTVGEGEKFLIINADGLDETFVTGKFIDDVYIKDGYVTWLSAIPGDSISLELILPANTPLKSETNSGNCIITVDGEAQYITASPSADDSWIGTHIIAPVDVAVSRFVNKLHLLGTNTTGMVMESSDAAFIPKELVLKISLTSPTSNKDIVISVAMELYRERTI